MFFENQQLLNRLLYSTNISSKEDTQKGLPTTEFLLFKREFNNKHHPTVTTTKINQRVSIEVVHNNMNKAFFSKSFPTSWKIENNAYLSLFKIRIYIPCQASSFRSIDSILPKEMSVTSMLIQIISIPRIAYQDLVLL